MLLLFNLLNSLYFAKMHTHISIKFIDFIKVISVDNLTDNQITELEFNNQRLEQIFSEFDDVQISIELNCKDDELSDEYEHRENTEELLSQNISIGRTLLKKFTIDLKSEHDSSSSVSVNVRRIKNNQIFNGFEGVKLPPIKLPILMVIT